MAVMLMSGGTPTPSNDPAVLKTVVVSLEAETAKLSTTLRAHDPSAHTLQMRIAKLQKHASGKNSEKIDREIEQLEPALEDLQVGPVTLLCRPKCSFRPFSFRMRPGFSSPMLSAFGADCRSR